MTTCCFTVGGGEGQDEKWSHFPPFFFEPFPKSVCVLTFRKVTGMLDLGECLTLGTYNIPSSVYIAPVQTAPPSDDGHFEFVGIRLS